MHLYLPKSYLQHFISYNFLFMEEFVWFTHKLSILQVNDALWTQIFFLKNYLY